MWHPDTQTPKPPNKPPNPSPKRTATKQLNTMAWPVQRTHFWTTFPPAPGFGQALKVSHYFWCFGIQFAPGIGFEMHLQLCLGVIPGQATTSPPKGFPKRAPRNRETAWPGRFNGPIFQPHFPGKTSRLNPLKNYTVLVRLWRFSCKTH